MSRVSKGIRWSWVTVWLTISEQIDSTMNLEKKRIVVSTVLCWIDFWLYFCPGVDCFDCLPSSPSQLRALWVSPAVPLSGVGDISTAYCTSSCICCVECLEEGRKYQKCESRSPVFLPTFKYLSYIKMPEQNYLNGLTYIYLKHSLY